jgi:sugar transferase (PEP-CTERM/EpsH1 system associated)
MKILMITEKFPFPPVDGVKLKVYHMLKGLSKRHTIVLLSFTEPDESIDFGDVKSFCEHIELVTKNKRNFLVPRVILNIFEREPFSLKLFDSPEMRGKIRNNLVHGNFDIVHLDMANTAQFFDLFGHIPTFIDPHDSITLNLRRRVRLERNLMIKFYQYIQLRKWENYERTMYSGFDKCFVVSDVDKQTLLSLNPEIDIAVAPNGVDVDFFRPLNFKKDYPSLVFSGSMESFQSYDAILYFYDKIYGHIKKRIPDIKLYVVGKNPPAAVRTLSKDNSVIVTGFVEDIRPYIDKSSIYICPIRSGSGIKNRLLEAMAMEKPIVAFRRSCEALKVTHNDHLLIVDTPKEFINGIIKLFEDEKLRRLLSQNARLLVEKEYSWEKTINIIENAYQDAISRKRLLENGSKLVLN